MTNAKDADFSFRLKYHDPISVIVATYKGAIVLTTATTNLWMTASDAERLARFLKQAAKRRRVLDAQSKRESQTRRQRT